MSDAVGAPAGLPPSEPIDLSVLERIEGELDAVERALEQIDQGVYEGFAGIGEVASTADPTEAAEPAEPEAPRDAGGAEDGTSGYA